MSPACRVWPVALAACLSACSLNRFAANQAGDIAAVSTGSLRGFWDYDIARAGTASGIMQLEGLHAISPDNEELTLTLVASYVGYAFGWIEADMEEAKLERRFAAAERLRARAELLYRRARDLSLAALRQRDADIDEWLVGDPDSLRRYLKDEYPDREDLAPVFWAASAWGSMLGQTNELDAAVDLPVIRALMEHVVAVDPGYESATGLVFLGGVYAQTPPDFGGDPGKARAYFERALELTGRKSHVIHVNYAKLYALTVGDQRLFRALLDEVLAPQDQGNPVRLSNKIARRHAELLLARQSRQNEGTP
jgi:hypothetical protein